MAHELYEKEKKEQQMWDWRLERNKASKAILKGKLSRFVGQSLEKMKLIEKQAVNEMAI